MALFQSGLQGWEDKYQNPIFYVEFLRDINHNAAQQHRRSDDPTPLYHHLSLFSSHIITGDMKPGRPPLTSLHEHGDLAAFGTLAQQVDHLIVRHALHISLVHLHDYVALL